MGEPYQIINPPGPITCFAYNKDRTQLALSPNNNEIHIYTKKAGEWTVGAILSEHDKLVTGVDWAPNSNRIVSCSQDRNAYVWTFDGAEKDPKKQWKPTLVILRISRAATQVKWSPKEDKFAVSSGHRCISVCYFEQDNDWWVSKHIRKPIRSTVLSVDWHPNNVLIACGCADFKARVFSGYIKGVDDKPPGTSWGSKMPFGECLGEYGTGGSGGWVHDAKFSPDGESMAYVGHDSTFSVVTGGQEPVTLTLPSLPYVCVEWLTPNSVVAAGHDCQPVLFNINGASTSLVKSLDAAKKVENKGGNSALDKFRNMDSRGQAENTDTNLPSIHQNAISSMAMLSGSRGKVDAFVTAGVDGKLTTWTIKTLESSMAGLKIA